MNFLPEGLRRGARYVLSGSSAAVINIGTLFILTHYFSLWYLIASPIAFSLSFVVSLALQRSWTFEVRGSEGIVRHSTLYLLVAIGNVVINTGLVLVCVEYVHTSYVLAQFIAGALISLESFFLYRRIFKS